MNNRHYGFTVELFPFINSIKTRGKIINPFGNKEGYFSKNFLWDTGATKSGINENIARKLELSIVGNTEIHTAGGKIVCNTYCVDIILPNGVRFNQIPICGVQLTEGTDVLIGMDIMKAGSFLFSQDRQTGKFFFEFSIPPIHNSIHKPQISAKIKKP